MPTTFEIELIQRTFFTVSVEAETEEEAINRAYEQDLCPVDATAFDMVVNNKTEVEQAVDTFQLVVSKARVRQQYGQTASRQLDILWAAIDRAEEIVKRLP